MLMHNHTNNYTFQVVSSKHNSCVGVIYLIYYLHYSLRLGMVHEHYYISNKFTNNYITYIVL